MTNTKNNSAACAIVAALMLPTLASADVIIVNTGTPTGTGAPALLYSAQSLAVEFQVSAGETIDTLSAYLTQGTAAPGDTFLFGIYQTLPTSSSRNPPLLYSFSNHWEQNGWNSATVNWAPTTTGDYWLVLAQPTAGRGSWQFDAPPLTSSSTGNPPALAFAFAGSSGLFSTTNAPTFGVEITASVPAVSPVPEPSTLAMLGLGGAALTGWRRWRKRTA
jgi:PEP-CTERM motif